MFRINKSFSPRPVFKARAKSTAGQDVLDRLKDYLKKAEKEPVYFLSRFWSDQKLAITYAEIAAAIQNGYLDAETLEQWRQDYAMIVMTKLAPEWLKAMAAANAHYEAAYSFTFDSFSDNVQAWIAEHGSQFVTRATLEQEKAINALLSHASAGGMNVDELSRSIRPIIGLTKPQTVANFNYYNHVKATLLKNNPNMKVETATKRAQEAALKYAAKQHRGRAQNIAQTELAYAYNWGAHEGIVQMQAEGLLTKKNKKWSTAMNEMVCEICGALEGKEVPMDGYFETGGHRFFIPPAHPGCNCAVAYVDPEEE